MKSILIANLVLGGAIFLFSLLGSSLTSEAWIMAQYDLSRMSDVVRQKEVADVIATYAHPSLYWSAIGISGIVVTILSIVGFLIARRNMPKHDGQWKMA
jgi:hypothetical protein